MSMMTAVGINMLSDSQESVIFDPSLMDHITNDLRPHGIEMDALTDEIFNESEKKYIPNMYQRPAVMNYNLPAQTTVATRDEFPGRYDFQLMLNQHGATKHWIYSQKLAKVFIDMDEVLPLRFKWEPALDGLFLRTQMVYVQEQHRSEPVVRCHNHMAMPTKEKTGIDPQIIRHVVRCVDRHSIYEETPLGHLTIRTPLGIPDLGAMYVPVHFKFLCKNSCTSGMNRRATELIFTLEDEHQNVLGRRRLQVRICSCPKRDKEKEEAEMGGKIKIPTKKRKLDSTLKKNSSFGDETAVFNINLEILGREEAMAVKKYAYDIMAGKALRTGQLDLYKPYLDKVLKPV